MVKQRSMAGLIESFRSSFGGECERLHEAIVAGTGSVGSHVVQFAASQFGEGTTTVALGFGKFLSGIHGPNRVVVVEGNLRAPCFRDILNLPATDGFQAVVEGRIKADEAIVPATEGGITVLPADRGQARGDLLASDSFRSSLGRVMSDLRQRFRFVLIDSAPIVPFFDGCILSTVVDAVVFVVESDRTRAEVVDHAIENLRSRGAKILGIVLNKRVFYIPNYVYRFL